MNAIRVSLVCVTRSLGSISVDSEKDEMTLKVMMNQSTPNVQDLLGYRFQTCPLSGTILTEHRQLPYGQSSFPTQHLPLDTTVKRSVPDSLQVSHRLIHKTF